MFWRKNKSHAAKGVPAGSRSIKAGFDAQGKPYIDLTDRETALMYARQAPRFKRIKLV